MLWTDELQARIGARPAPLDPRLAMVGVGWAVWERRPPLAEHLGRGGTVVGVEDRDDGRRIFKVLDHPHGQLRIFELADTDLEPAATAPPNSAVLRGLIRLINRTVGSHRGAMTGWDVTLLATAADLAEMIA
jgi:hypothetical protein